MDMPCTSPIPRISSAFSAPSDVAARGVSGTRSGSSPWYRRSAPLSATASSSPLASYSPSRGRANTFASTDLGSDSVSAFSGGPAAQKCAFNARFQYLLDKTEQEDSASADRFEMLASLSKDFEACALQWGRGIILERTATDRLFDKCSAGGRAGGEKHEVHGILFKMANNSQGLYESVNIAAKEAGHTLRGVTELHAASANSLRVPMTLLIDWLGWRLTAMALLPIQAERTLVLGSQDGGKTYFHRAGKGDEAYAAMAAAARALNIARHPIAPKRVVREPLETSEVSSGVSVADDAYAVSAEGSALCCVPASREYAHGPADLELHWGTDQQLYAVDAARLFPPEPTTQAARPDSVGYAAVSSGSLVPPAQGAHLVQLLRPELVRQYEEPLSSDAFTRFGKLDADKINGAVQRCFQHMLMAVIPELARRLDARRTELQGPSMAGFGLGGRTVSAQSMSVQCSKCVLEQVVYPCDENIFSRGAVSKDLVLQQLTAAGQLLYKKALEKRAAARTSSGSSSSGGGAAAPARPSRPVWGAAHLVAGPSRAALHGLGNRKPSSSTLSRGSKQLSTGVGTIELQGRERPFPGPSDCDALVASVHVHGVNLRHLGKVLSHTRNLQVQLTIITECIARAMRVLLFERLQHCSPDPAQFALGQLAPFRAATLEFLNAALRPMARPHGMPGGSSSVAAMPRLPALDASSSSIGSMALRVPTAPPPNSLDRCFTSWSGLSSEPDASLWKLICDKVRAKFGIDLCMHPGAGLSQEPPNGSVRVMPAGQQTIAQCICAWTLVSRFCKLTGVKLSEAAIRALSRHPDQFLQQRQPLHDIHVEDLQPRIKATPLLLWASAKTHSTRFRKMKRELGWAGLGSIAEQAFQDLVMAAPAYAPGLVGCSKLYTALEQADSESARLAPQPTSAANAGALSALMLLRAYRTHPQHYQTLHAAGVMLKEESARRKSTDVMRGDLGEAAAGFMLEALHFVGEQPCHKLLKDLANAYTHNVPHKSRAEGDTNAWRCFLTALATCPGSPRTLVNLARLLHFKPQAGLTTKARLGVALEHCNVLHNPHRLSALYSFLRRAQQEQYLRDNSTADEWKIGFAQAMGGALQKCIDSWDSKTVSDSVSKVSMYLARLCGVPMGASDAPAAPAALQCSALMAMPSWLLRGSAVHTIAKLVLWLVHALACTAVVLDGAGNLRQSRPKLFAIDVVRTTQNESTVPELPMDLRCLPLLSLVSVQARESAWEALECTSNDKAEPSSAPLKTADWIQSAVSGQRDEEIAAQGVAAISFHRDDLEQGVADVQYLAQFVQQVSQRPPDSQVQQALLGERERVERDIAGIIRLGADVARQLQREGEAATEPSQRRAYQDTATYIAKCVVLASAPRDLTTLAEAGLPMDEYKEQERHWAELVRHASTLAAFNRETEVVWKWVHGKQEEPQCFAVQPGASGTHWLGVLCLLQLLLMHASSPGPDDSPVQRGTWSVRLYAQDVVLEMKVRAADWRVNLARAAIETCAVMGASDTRLLSFEKTVIPNLARALAYWEVSVSSTPSQGWWGARAAEQPTEPIAAVLTELRGLVSRTARPREAASKIRLPNKFYSHGSCALVRVAHAFHRCLQLQPASVPVPLPLPAALFAAGSGAEISVDMVPDSHKKYMEAVLAVWNQPAVRARHSLDALAASLPRTDQRSYAQAAQLRRA